MLSNSEVLSVLKPGQHGSTFGGNPLACAVARAALKVLVEEGMIENARIMGERFMQGLRGFNHPVVKDVRGRGLLMALELDEDSGGARRYTEALMERGLLCKETHTHTIRFAPPLVITAPEVDWALERIDATLKQDLS